MKPLAIPKRRRVFTTPGVFTQVSALGENPVTLQAAGYIEAMRQVVAGLPEPWSPNDVAAALLRVVDKPTYERWVGGGKLGSTITIWRERGEIVLVDCAHRRFKRTDKWKGNHQ